MRRTRYVALPVRAWQYVGLLVVSLACLTLGLVSRDKEGRAGSLAGPELKHRAPHEVDACPNLNPFIEIPGCPNRSRDWTRISTATRETSDSRSALAPVDRGLSRSRSVERVSGAGLQSRSDFRSNPGTGNEIRAKRSSDSAIRLSRSLRSRSAEELGGSRKADRGSIDSDRRRETGRRVSVSRERGNLEREISGGDQRRERNVDRRDRMRTVIKRDASLARDRRSLSRTDRRDVVTDKQRETLDRLDRRTDAGSNERRESRERSSRRSADNILERREGTHRSRVTREKRQARTVRELEDVPDRLKLERIRDLSSDRRSERRSLADYRRVSDTRFGSAKSQKRDEIGTERRLMGQRIAESRTDRRLVERGTNRRFVEERMDQRLKEQRTDRRMMTPEADRRRMEEIFYTLRLAKQRVDQRIRDRKGSSRIVEQKPDRTLMEQRAGRRITEQRSDPSVLEQRAGRRITEQRSDRTVPEQRAGRRIMAQRPDRTLTEQKAGRKIMEQRSDPSVLEQRAGRRITEQRSDRTVPEQRAGRRIMTQRSDRTLMEQRAGRRIMEQRSDPVVLKQRAEQRIMEQRSDSTVAEQRAGRRIMAQRSDRTLMEQRAGRKIMEQRSDPVVLKQRAEHRIMEQRPDRTVAEQRAGRRIMEQRSVRARVEQRAERRLMSRTDIESDGLMEQRLGRRLIETRTNREETDARRSLRQRLDSNRLQRTRRTAAILLASDTPLNEKEQRLTDRVRLLRITSAHGILNNDAGRSRSVNRELVRSTNRASHSRLTQRDLKDFATVRENIKPSESSDRHRDLRILSRPSDFMFKRKTLTAANLLKEENSIKEGLTFEVIRQALVIGLCTMYGLSTLYGKRSFVTNFMSQAARFNVW